MKLSMLMSQERKEYLRKKLKHAATEFGKVGTRSDHQIVPKEEQLSINLGNRKSFDIINPSCGLEVSEKARKIG